MKKILRKILFGDAMIREYATVKNGSDDDIKERVFFKNGKDTIDVSRNHWLLCLEPIVFGIWIKKEAGGMGPDKKEASTLYFSGDNTNSRQNTTAIVVLDFLDIIEEEDGCLFLFKLKKCRLYQTGFIRTWLLYIKYYKKPGLSFNKLKSFAAAYSYPRRVRIISFKQDGYYNIFPMDLLGDIGRCNRYVFGLRHTNVTLPKIIETKKIVVSEISFEHKDIIYQLGKHHSVSPPLIDSLPFGVMKSKDLGFYIPEWAESYKEIAIDKTINLGSHMLLWGKSAGKNVLKNPGSHLYHIHFLLYLYHKHKGPGYPDLV